MNNRTVVKIFASDVAPSPKSNVLWMDLASDGNGGVVKNWNGSTWVKTEYTVLSSPTFTGTVTTPAVIVSSETASTLASFDATKNVKSLALATYPSLTEVSYVKGVTSAIQTQIGLKANAASPVFTGTSKMALASYADDAAAKTGGLTVGMLYQVTGTGVVMCVQA